MNIAAAPVTDHATYLYVERKINEIAKGKSLTVLDMGCGVGQLMELIVRDGHDVYGYDLEPLRESATERLRILFPADFEQRVRFTADEAKIPFESKSFDVIYSNQVFEHVKFLEPMIRETARVLKPGGLCIAIFPYATRPIEGHLHIPFVHWLPPGRTRIAYMTFCYFLRGKGTGSLAHARKREEYLCKRTFYRFKNEFAELASVYFERFESDVGAYIQAKLDLMACGSLSRRVLARMIRPFHGAVLSFLVANGISDVSLFVHPRYPNTRTG